MVTKKPTPQKPLDFIIRGEFKNGTKYKFLFLHHLDNTLAWLRLNIGYEEEKENRNEKQLKERKEMFLELNQRRNQISN